MSVGNGVVVDGLRGAEAEALRGKEETPPRCEAMG